MMTPPSSRRTLTALLLALLASLTVAGLAKLRLDVDIFHLLPTSLPAVHALQLQQNLFQSSAELIVAIDSDSPETSEQLAQAIASALRNASNLVAAAHWQPPWQEFPLLAAEWFAYSKLNGPSQDLERISNRTTHPAAHFLQARDLLASSLSPDVLARLAFDPLGLTENSSTNAPLPGSNLNLFASTDGRFRIVTVSPALPLDSYPQCQQWIQTLRMEIQQASSPFTNAHSRISLTGRPLFVAEIAASMESDLRTSILSTSALVAALFLAAYRTVRPLIPLLLGLAVTLLLTLAAAGLLLHSINVMSLGFAAILIGLSVDYALVLYQESIDHPHCSPARIRRIAAPAILSSAATTAAAFATLNFSHLPGLQQLGSLVALGIAFGTATFLIRFPKASSQHPLSPAPAPPQLERPNTPQKFSLVPTVIILFASAALLLSARPAFDPTPTPLRPIRSEAYSTAELVAAKLGKSTDSLWFLASGRSEQEVLEKLLTLRSITSNALSQGTLANAILPDALWPNPAQQLSNRPLAHAIVAQWKNIEAEADRHGFTPDALHFTQALFQTWQRHANSTNIAWPTNAVSQWILSKFVARKNSQLWVLGLAQPHSHSTSLQSAHNLQSLAQTLAPHEIHTASWNLLGESLLATVQEDSRKMLASVALVLVVSLALAFRRLADVLLALAALLASGVLLLALMQVARLSWNLMNLVAIPLLLGSGIDYSIHILLALRRAQGNIAAVRKSTGRALFLCAATTAAGFASLLFSNNAGLASLGAVCALGITAAFFVAYALLPHWWSRLNPSPISPPKASSLYQDTAWKLGLLAARSIPRPLAIAAAKIAALAYWLAQPQRRTIVLENLRPLAPPSPHSPHALARQLFSNFAVKLVDLWRYEANIPNAVRFNATSGWSHFESAHHRKNGVLLVTLHLGNWELGGPLLTKKGFPLLALSNAEPNSRLTRLRQNARALHGVETLIVGENPFAFVTVIQRLNAGATVALLLDRPHPKSATLAQIAGRPLPVSLAAAELARASGCAILPVVILQSHSGYSADILPEIPYQRAQLNSHAARSQFTQSILNAFEPILLKHPDQWFHFVPVWDTPQSTPASNPNAQYSK